jgi:hypothetical protein
MALIRRTVAATLAGVALAGAAVLPAQAYWISTGRGTGTVPTASASLKVVSLSLSVSSHKVTASGSAGGTGYSATVKVVLCAVNTGWPCPQGSVLATLTSTVAGGAYSAQSGNLNGATVYGLASQTENSGWPDYSAVAGPVRP